MNLPSTNWFNKIPRIALQPQNDTWRPEHSQKVNGYSKITMESLRGSINTQFSEMTKESTLML